MLLISKAAIIICLTSISQCEEENVIKDNSSKVKVNSGVKPDQKNNTAKEDNEIEKPEPGFDFTEEEMRKFKIWHEGVIPYYIDDLSFDESLRVRLRQLLNDYNRLTGLGFMEISVPPNDEKERWVLFINRRGALSCEDYTTKSFTNAGVQRVVLGYDCLGAGGLASTVLALAGVPPQHNAPNRDEHIDVVSENIIPAKRDLFQVLKNSEWLFHDLPYDFHSAGHYDFHKYTRNGSATILPKENMYQLFDVGEGKGISKNDITKIKMLYNYISLNRGKAKSSDCSRLFKPGVNFTQFKTGRNNNIKPRKKPEQYDNNKFLNVNENKIDKPDNEPENNNKIKIEDSKELNVSSKVEEKYDEDHKNYKNKTDTILPPFSYAKNTTRRELKVFAINTQGQKKKSRRTTRKTTQIFLKFNGSDIDTDEEILHPSTTGTQKISLVESTRKEEEVVLFEYDYDHFY